MSVTDTAQTLHHERIALLKAHLRAVQPDDLMAEAGRKVLLAQFIIMLKHEAGSRTGEDIEDVHDMRVAIRRMRSALRLLSPYYKAKIVRAYNSHLRTIARALGAVRDLDVLLVDLQRHADAHDDTARLQPLFEMIEEDIRSRRQDLNRALDKNSYAQFIEDFTAFLLTEGAGARADHSGDVQPSRVRHVLPTLIYTHLGSVRAYDEVLPGADDTTLHALRIEFKRLRYAVTLFSDVLGSSVKDFIEEIKTAQDHLGRMNDIVSAQAYLRPYLKSLDAETTDALSRYLDALDAENAELHAGVPALWKRFNSKPVQKLLANAIAAL